MQFNKVQLDNGEWLEGFQIIETEWDKDGTCKRCREPFTKKYGRQVFCSRECAGKYYLRIKEKCGTYKRFKMWLDSCLIDWKDFNEFNI